jgi:uncharacterized protein
MLSQSFCQILLNPLSSEYLLPCLSPDFFPEDLTTLANEHPLVSMLIMMTAGMPMYVCATSSTPIAAALIIKGLNAGAAPVFLLTGPATNVATMNIIRAVFNIRALVIYIFMIAVCSLCLSYMLDYIYVLSDIQASAVMGQASELIPYPIQLLSSLILGLGMIWNMFSVTWPKP